MCINNYQMRTVIIKSVKFFIFLLIIFLHSVTFAQDLRFGIVAGPNFSTFNTDFFDAQFRVGIHGGIMAEISISDKWGLHTELQYSQQGMAWKDGQTKYKNYNNYLSIPVTFGYNFKNWFALEFGPGIGILIKSKEIINYPGIDEEKNTIDQYNRIDFGVILGAQFSISKHFQVGVRYYHGLTYVEIGADRKKNRHFQVPVTYRF